MLFSRRTIQSILDELSRVLSAAELAEMVRRLNSPRDRLAVIWEAAILYGLSRTGGVSHHAPLPSGRKPDVTFALPGSSQTSFVADITTVSDAGHHTENPVEAFSDDFERFVEKTGLNPSNFHFQVESHKVGNKIKLRLPKRVANVAMLRKYVRPFLQEIKVSGRRKDKREFNEPDFGVTVSYDRQQRYMTRSHRVYSQALSIEQNPLWNKLKDKADQVKNSDALLSGVIVCDGGCSLLSTSMRDIGSFSADDIIRQFLRKRSSIDFVYTVTSRRGHGIKAKHSFQGEV